METPVETPTFKRALVSSQLRLERVSELEYPYPFRPIQDGRPASVLLLCGLRESANESSSLEFLITRRTASLETHKSQYALPGGSVDPEDGIPGEIGTKIVAALRETEEEVGIPRSLITPIGLLPPIWTPSGFQITPVIGLLKRPIEEVRVIPSEAEIDFWFWCGMDCLQDPAVYSKETRKITHGGVTTEVPVDVFQIAEHRVWGATAAILKNFIGRWEKLS